jgi:uncharacterized LabA/DUF88 family protein
VDRCALFVDAGYVLADGAMAVHGTHRRESVSWDYAGLVQLLGHLAKEQSGLPLLRCYWYEATVEGRRTAEHDTLADLPGVKLRLAKMRPGRREGVESEIHRDLATLARNKAVTDAVVLSAEEDLAQVVADVQDLGMRVTLLHIGFEGNGTIPRSLRQECDDIVELGSAHLRPYVELISGAEPPPPDKRDGAQGAVRPAVNGHGQAGDTVAYPPAAQEADAGRQAYQSGYAAPAAGYQRSAPQLSRSQPEDPPAAAGDFLAALAGEPASAPRGAAEQPDRPDLPSAQPDAPPVRQNAPAEQDQGQDLGAVPPEQAAATAGAEYAGATPDLAALRPEQARVQPPYRPEYAPRADLYGAPVAVPAPPDEQPAVFPAPLPARGRVAADLSGYNPGAVREQPSRDPMAREPRPDEQAEGLQPVPASPVAPASAQVRRLPSRGTGQPAQQAEPAQPAFQPHVLSAPTGAPAMPPTAGHPMPAQPMPPGPGQPGPGQPMAGQSGPGQSAGLTVAVPQSDASQPMPMDVDPAYSATRNGSYGAPRSVLPARSDAPGVPGGGAQAATGGLTVADGPAGPAGQPGPAGLAAPAGAHHAGLGGQPAVGYQAPSMPAPSAAPPGAVNGAGQPTAYTQGVGGPVGPGGYGNPAGPGGFGAPGGGPAGPVGQGGPAYPGVQTGGSLADAVQSAHQEGQEFGESVARDAPALWLEAVLARKPRMPSDLEARLLQGSALPIDYLLHDEVRHALRRGFWDALERARR